MAGDGPERDPGTSTDQPRRLRGRTQQKAAGMKAAEHYAEGSGYLDAQTKGELAVGQKSGLHRKSSRRLRGQGRPNADDGASVQTRYKRGRR